MEADLLGRVRKSNGCTVGSSVDSVVVAGYLLRGHVLMGGERRVSGVAGKATGRSYIA